VLETKSLKKWPSGATHMVQLMPGLLYVVIITAVFTVLLVGLTAVSLLSQARAIARRRFIGTVYSRKNVEILGRHKPVLATMTAVLQSIRDMETDRELTTFKRPATVRLYENWFYLRPHFSSGAYLVPLSNITSVSTINDALAVTFSHGERSIALQYRCKNLSNWRDSLNRLRSNHK
jgi:hypothetical protein